MDNTAGSSSACDVLDLCIDKGAEFSSYTQLERVFEQRKLIFGERWVVAKSATAEYSNKTAKASNLYPLHLKYSHVSFRCTHERLSHSYHDHESETNYCHYAEDRAATVEEAREINKLVGFGVTAGKIVTHFAELGKNFKTKDIYNIAARNKIMSEIPHKRLKSEKSPTDESSSDQVVSSSAPQNSREATASACSLKEVPDKPFSFTDELTLEELRQKWTKFNNDRDWDKFHAPRNVLLDMVSEVGELSEIFQWKGEVTEGLPELTAAEKTHVGEELSDVLLAVINMAHKCQVDLTQAVLDKMVKTGKKYPVDKCYGKSNKYTDYQS